LLAAHGESSNFFRIGLETALIGTFGTAPWMPLLPSRSRFTPMLQVVRTALRRSWPTDNHTEETRK
jgi:hypothetical protein